MVSDGTEFAGGDIERLCDESRRNTKVKHEKWEKYYNRRRRDVQIKVNDWVLIKTHPLSSATKKVVTKFKPNLKVRIEYQGERDSGKADKRVPLIRYHHLALVLNLVERLKGEGKDNIGYKRLQESGSGGSERKIKNLLEHRISKRALSLNYNKDLPKYRKKGRIDQIGMPSTSKYNLRPRRGGKVKSRLTSEMRTEQTGPVRASKSREHHYSPDIEEQARPSSKNTRRRSSQQ
ncbi:uncharacterized protein TNCV_4467511 [Trichonephila clavipes]|nr:uncharacterized protein TNCV_4467511 [Trichonephila clavipes]